MIRYLIFAMMLFVVPAKADWIGPPNSIMCNKVAGWNGVAVATQVVAPVAGKTVYVCGFMATNTTSTAYSFQLNYGTQTTTPCDTNTVNLVANITVQTAPVIDHQTYATSSGAVGSGLCVTPTNGAINGHVWYAQY